MKIYNKNLKYKIAKKLYYISLKIDNSNNCNFDTNGEKKSVESLFKKLNQKEQITLFEVGGNVGDYTQILFDNAKKTSSNFTIHVFEPTQFCFKKLSDRFRDERIILNNCACSESSGHSEIFYDSKGSGLASMYKRNLKLYNIDLGIKETIKTERLDAYIKQKQISHIDFMKVDVEGHEMSVFKGMGDFLRLDFIDYIQFEYGGANLDSMTSLMDLTELLVSKGFTIAKIMPDGLQIREYEQFLENFEYSNYVAISNRIL